MFFVFHRHFPLTDAVPPVPTLRLSADAAEWHPPSFIAATAEADIIGQQPEPLSVAEIDASQDKPPESSAAAPQPSTNSITPPSTPRDGGAAAVAAAAEAEEEEEGGEGGVQAPRSTAAVVPGDSAADSKEPVFAASPVAVSSSEFAVQGEVSLSSVEGEGTAAALEVEGSAATSVAAAASFAAEEAGAVATGATSEDHSQSVGFPAQPPAALPEVVPTNLEDSTGGDGGGGGADVAAEAFAGLEGAAGGKTEATAEDSEDYARRGQESTDVTSDPTDDDGSDPDLSPVGGGIGDGGKFGGEDEREREGGGGGGGFFENPALRWGGAVALAGALLVIGLRRAR